MPVFLRLPDIWRNTNNRQIILSDLQISFLMSSQDLVKALKDSLKKIKDVPKILQVKHVEGQKSTKYLLCSKLFVKTGILYH